MTNFWQKLKKPVLALAPMAGITDSAFRQICKKYGADVVYSEMASVDALFFKSQKTLELLKFDKKERPYIVQLFGKKPEHFAAAAKIVTKKIKPDGIDINFGCPAKKVFGHGSGCALMPQKELAREIIFAVCKNTSLPVSIKIRAGLKNINALEFIKNVKDLPFQAVMVHGRTYEGKFSGKVDFEIVEKIKKIIPNRIVLANGGITEPDQAIGVFKKYPLLDGIGIARGTLGCPWIFDEIKEILKCHPARQLADSTCLPVGRDLKYVRCRNKFGMTNFIKKIIVEHYKLIYKDKQKLGIFEIRKHLAWYVKGFPGAAELRKKLVQTKSLKEVRKILDEIK